jgi:hypothetical protein
MSVRISVPHWDIIADEVEGVYLYSLGESEGDE